MTPTTQTDYPFAPSFPGTLGGRALGSEAVRRSVDAAVEEILNASAAITDIKGPDPELAERYKQRMDAAAASRGRGLLYPYIGSGLGNGALVELGDGSVKWDMISGIGVHFFGHSHPELVRAAVHGGLEDTVKHGNLQSGDEAFRFNETLCELASRNSDLKYCFTSTSGAMANENALKVCYQKHAPASRILAFKHNFMGRTTTMAQITDNAAYRQGIPLTTQVDYMPFWNEEAAEKVGGKTAFIDHCVWRLRQFIERYPNQHACFIFELTQGEGGFNTAPREFFVALMDVCRDAGIAIWDDEIQSFGRLNRMFAYEAYDVGSYVDVFCVGKMTQACATMWTEAYNPKGGLLSGTFTGATADFTAGRRILEMLRDGDYYDTDAGPGLISKHHARFRELARAMVEKHPDWFPKVPFVPDNVAGMGGMMRLTPFGGEQSKVAGACKIAFEEGLIAFWCGHGPYHLRFLPPLGVMKLEDWPRVFGVLERSLARAAG